jgi:hypothetical protein
VALRPSVARGGNSRFLARVEAQRAAREADGASLSAAKADDVGLVLPQRQK